MFNVLEPYLYVVNTFDTIDGESILMNMIISFTEDKLVTWKV